MAVVALGTFRESRKSTPTCTISRHISELQNGLPGSQPTHRWALERPLEEMGKKNGAKAGHQGPGELAGSIWDRPRRLLPLVRGAFQSRETRGCCALVRCTYPAWVVPSARARVPGIRHGADCASALPVCCSARPAQSRPGAHHAAPRGPPLAATHPDRPAASRVPPVPCCLCAVSAPSATHTRAMTQDPRRVYIRTHSPSRPSGTFRHPRTARGGFFPPFFLLCYFVEHLLFTPGCWVERTG
jgi:hypothetical protein